MTNLMQKPHFLHSVFLFSLPKLILLGCAAGSVYNNNHTPLSGTQVYDSTSTLHKIFIAIHALGKKNLCLFYLKLSNNRKRKQRI